MQPLSARIIKSVKFEDGSYAIKPAPQPVAESELLSDDPTVSPEVADQVARNVKAEAEAALRHAQHEAELALQAAREEAAAIREQALAEAETIKSQAFSESHERGFAEGVKTGQEAGYAAVLNAFEGHLGALADASEAAARERQAWFATNEKDMVKLAIMIAQKILLMELTTSRESIHLIAEAALRRLTDRTHVKLRVHPDDLERVMIAKERLMLEVENLSVLEVVADARVGVAGCVAETKTGMVDARLATQLSQVAASLLELPLGMESEMDQVIAETVKALAQKGDVQSLLAREALPPAPPAPPVRSMPMPAPAPAPVPALVAPVTPPAPVLAPAPQPVTDWSEPAPPPAFTPIEEVIEAPSPAFFAPVEPAAMAVPEAIEYPLPAPELETAVEAVRETHASPLQPELVVAEPVVEAAPAAPAMPTAPAPRAADPSRRAADALALRLGQLKKGKGVSTLSEEQQMQLMEGALTDEELAAIVQHVMPRASMDIGTDEVLVHNPNLDLAAEALAERLGQKKNKRLDAAQLDALAAALGDESIDTIMQNLVPHAAGDEAPKADAPNLDSVAERLAERLGKKVRKPVFPEFGTTSKDEPASPFGEVLKDDTIDQILGSITPVAPAETPAEAAPQPDISKASENLAKLLGQKKKGNRAWYEGVE